MVRASWGLHGRLVELAQSLQQNLPVDVAEQKGRDARQTCHQTMTPVDEDPFAFGGEAEMHRSPGHFSQSEMRSILLFWCCDHGASWPMPTFLSLFADIRPEFQVRSFVSRPLSTLTFIIKLPLSSTLFKCSNRTLSKGTIMDVHWFGFFRSISHFTTPKVTMHH